MRVYVSCNCRYCKRWNGRCRISYGGVDRARRSCKRFSTLRCPLPRIGSELAAHAEAVEKLAAKYQTMLWRWQDEFIGRQKLAEYLLQREREKRRRAEKHIASYARWDKERALEMRVINANNSALRSRVMSLKCQLEQTTKQFRTQLEGKQ